MQRRAFLIAAAMAAIAGCTTTTTNITPGPAADVAPTLVIEQFLRAANANDLDALARLFDTRQGPIIDIDTKQQVDDRMFAIASVLRHKDYRVEGEQLVPGRRDVATQYLVRLMLPDDREVVVPFTMVYSEKGTWLVEQIALEKITQSR